MTTQIQARACDRLYIDGDAGTFHDVRCSGHDANSARSGSKSLRAQVNPALVAAGPGSRFAPWPRTVSRPAPGDTTTNQSPRTTLHLI